jgi:hypothetical protein
LGVFFWGIFKSAGGVRLRVNRIRGGEYIEGGGEYIEECINEI